MEHAPLRPVPTRPPAPVDADRAVEHVAAALPGLDAPAAAALALVALLGSGREEAAARAGLQREELAAALARARKVLRRSMFPLPGSGWCERAERLVSDRLDDALEGPEPRRLEVHLRNCARCVQHERRLVQATDALVTSFAPAALAAPVPARAPSLTVVERSAAPSPAARPFGEPVRPAPPRPRPAREPEPPPSPFESRLLRNVLLYVLAVLGVALAAALALGASL